MNSDVSNHSRNGKIAHFPQAIREKLNLRLADGERSRSLVQWLNSLPEVRECLATYFDGRPINDVNLSAWKVGGFRDWLRGQEVRARARDFFEEAVELAEETATFPGNSPLLDRVTDRMALALLQVFRQEEDSEPGRERTRSMLEISRELTRLRREGHQRLETALRRKDAEKGGVFKVP